ncbi:hypothetical protein I7E32_17175 [Alcaligenes faecalis]|nr:hypothetical protein [Alcaligenes faecalis]
MPLDFEAKDRPDNKEQIKFIRKLMRDSSVKYKNGTIKGVFEEKVNFDFVINEYAFKIFRFEGREKNRLIGSIKNWAYDAYKLKDKYKIVFIVDDISCGDQFKTLYEILEEESDKVIPFSELVAFVKHVS